ncbi:MAG TPA: UbiA family prenyltransferase [Acidimicrobiia bacterium]|nr:UbiA family prenyltransferase [Acidimicrobiia bacterium]
MGPEAMKNPAYYAKPGSTAGDLLAILHPPYTAWHLSYVAMGAALAPTLDWQRLLGTLVAFFLGTGVAAHSLDELKGRPLGTKLSNEVLWALGVGGLAGALVVAAVGASVISPWVWLWAGIGSLLATGYALERPGWLHTTIGFALAWGGFPALVGYWAQTEMVSVSAVLLAIAASLVSAAQRVLSTPARHVRRQVERTEMHLERSDTVEVWDEARVLATWERPLRLLAWSMVALAAGLVLARTI